MQPTREQTPSDTEHTATGEDPSQLLEMATGAVLPSGTKREWGSEVEPSLPFGHGGGYVAPNFPALDVPILLSPTKGRQTSLLSPVKTPTAAEQGPKRKLRKVGPPLWSLPSSESQTPVAPITWPVQPAAPIIQPDFTPTIGLDSPLPTGAHQHPGQAGQIKQEVPIPLLSTGGHQHVGQPGQPGQSGQPGQPAGLPGKKKQELPLLHPSIVYPPVLSMGSNAYGSSEKKSEAVNEDGLLVPLPPRSQSLAPYGEGIPVSNSSTAALETKVKTESNQAAKAAAVAPPELMPLAPSSCSSSPSDPTSSSGYVCSRVEELFPKLLFLPGHPLQVGEFVAAGIGRGMVKRELHDSEWKLKVTALPKLSMIFKYSPPSSDASVIKTKRRGPFKEKSSGAGFDFTQLWQYMQAYSPKHADGATGYATLISCRHNQKKQICYVTVEFDM